VGAQDANANNGPDGLLRTKGLTLIVGIRKTLVPGSVVGQATGTVHSKVTRWA
jgi:hypothetical protein